MKRKVPYMIEMIFKLTVNFHLRFGLDFIIVTFNKWQFLEKINKRFAFYDLFLMKGLYSAIGKVKSFLKTNFIQIRWRLQFLHFHHQSEIIAFILCYFMTNFCE